MNAKNQARFIYSVAVILFVMAACELFTATGIPPLLNQCDPILGLPLRQVFYLMAGVELVLSAYLLAGQNAKLKLTLIAWLILNLFVYQAGLRWNGAPNYLSCLGNLNANFPISPRVLIWILRPLLGYCFLGSCVFLIWDWLYDRKSADENRAVVAPKEGAQGQIA